MGAPVTVLFAAAFLALPVMQTVAADVLPPVNALDCYSEPAGFSDPGVRKWRTSSFEYTKAGEPVFLNGQTIVALQTAGKVWTLSVNNCGMSDETNIGYDATQCGNCAPASGNIHNEAYWVSGPEFNAIIQVAITPSDCDIQINRDWFNQLPNQSGGVAFLTSKLVKSMGKCIGLEEHGDLMQSMGEGTCLLHNEPLQDRVCGTTLARGDLEGARLLWPNP